MRHRRLSGPLGVPPPVSDVLRGVTVANLFTEPSTRTRVSFELAAKRLGADVVNLEMQLSSRVKGESMLDTVFTLQSLHVDVMVIRDAEAWRARARGRECSSACECAVRWRSECVAPNAGLLDALTVRQHKRRFDGLSIAIVGDIRHSRVARSSIRRLYFGRAYIRYRAPCSYA